MYFTNVLVFFVVAMSASAISTQHMARNVYHRRHAIAARGAAPEAASTPLVAPSVVPKKRAVKRCKAKNSTTSSLLGSTSATPSSSAIASSVDIQPTSAPINVGGDPPTFSSSVAPSSVAPLPPPSSSAAPAPQSSSFAPVPSSSAPAPSSSAPPKETPTTSSVVQTPTPVKTTPTTSAPSPSPSSGDGGLLTSQHTGDATWYETGLGACGITNNDSQYIVAVSYLLFDSFPGYDGVNPNDNPICGKTATASWGGNSVQVTITDRCAGCDIEWSLDFSPSAFSVLAPQSEGRLYDMVWAFD